MEVRWAADRIRALRDLAVEAVFLHTAGTETENCPFAGGDPFTETVVPAGASTCTLVGVFALQRFT